MKTLASMSKADKSQYLNLLMGATEKVLVPDAECVIVLLDKTECKNCIYIATRTLDAPRLLRDLADRIEADDQAKLDAAENN